MKNKIVFTVDGDEAKVSYAVVRPSPKVLTEAQKVYNKAFRDALESGAILREKLDSVLKSQGLWDDDKQKEYDDLNRKFKTLEISLLKGKMSKDDGRKIALKMRGLRSEMRDMLSSRNSLDSFTAQAQADSVRFNYLVSACTVYNDTGKVVFNDLEDYLSKSTEDLAFKAATKLSVLLYDLDDDYEKKLPENKFLLKFKYVDEDLRLVNKDGKWVDEEGNLIDKDGRFVNALGQYVDKYGNRVDEKGEYIIEDGGDFFDDADNPIN